MRLCFLAPANSTHTQKWIEYFRKKEYEIHLISFDFADIEGISFYYLNAPFKLFYFLCVPKIKRLIERIKPDILHAHYASSYGFAGAASDFHPLVISVWGSDVTEFPRHSLIHRKILKHSLDQADRITVTSKMLEELTGKLTLRRKRIRHIPFGVDLDKFKPESRNNKTNAITIGVIKGLDHKYGIEYLIKGFALVEKRYENIKLLIVGDGPLRCSLQKLAFQLGCEKKVEFVGSISHFQVPGFLHEMDIFVMPSIQESFGVAALEASACGLPVVASNVGGLPEVVLDNKTGLVVPPRDPFAIAEAIIYLIENPGMRERFGKCGRELVMKNYSWQENAQRMENLYKEVLGQS